MINLLNTWMFNEKPINANAASGPQPPVIIGGGDLGNKTAPFTITYKVYDPAGESVTVLEKLNGVAINTRPNVPQKTDLMFEITQALWDALAINTNHSITLEAINESELSSSRHFTFYRQNNIPSAPSIINPVTGASAVGATTLEWTASTDPDVPASQTITYKVYFSTNGGVTKIQIGETTNTSVIWDVTDLTPGDTYQIYVCANDGIDDSPFGISGVFKVLSTPKRLSVPQFIEVTDIDGNTVALLSPESDGLKECWIDREINGASKLEFELALTSEKWAYLNPKNRIHVQAQNRTYEFVIANPDAMERSRDGEKLTGKVLANETWTLLGKKFQTLSNDPSTPNPPWGAVVIVSGGSDLSGGRYSVGSAGHALYALLNGTGWTLDTVDVTGTFDLETEKESVLANINKVQELWGGYLVWDSPNKTVSLRNKETWQNYTGYQIRYGKNLKGITRYDDTDIITRLYPFGENDLNIADVNGGNLFLDNQSYTTKILEGVWYNQDIKDQTQLKQAGTEYLAEVCKPRYKYSTEIIDLRVLEYFQHEVFALGDMVDVIDPELGIEEYQRIIRHRFNVFQPWLCELDIGDPLEKIAASIANSVKMADYIKSNVRPNPSFQNILKAIINTAATEINGASGDYTCIDGVLTFKERVSGVLTGNLLRITPLGMIISSDGGQTWDLAINGEGINASMINTGILNAAIVNILSANGKFQIVDNGLKVYDASDVLRVHIGEYATGKYGIKIFDGEIYGSLFRTGGSDDTTGSFVEIAKYSVGSKYGYVHLTDSGGNLILKIEAGGDQGSVHFLHTGTEKGNISIRALTTRELALESSDSSGIYIAASTGETIKLGPTDGSSSVRGIQVTGFTGDIYPRADAGGACGQPSKKWTGIWAYTNGVGDLAFIEKECAICGKRFNSGDILGLVVKTIENDYTYTIPVHIGCQGKSAKITLPIPVFENKHVLKDDGSVEIIKEEAHEEYDEDIMLVHPDYDFDEATGYFFRKVNEYNVAMFGDIIHQQRIYASKRNALVVDTVKKRVPKYRDVEVIIGQEAGD